MFEITYSDNEMLENYIDAGKAYKGGIYDFTFEKRYLAPFERVSRSFLAGTKCEDPSFTVNKHLHIVRVRKF